MTQGSIKFETMKVTALGASAMFSIPNGDKAENYFAAVVGLDLDSYELAGGVFFGRSCDLDPLLMIDPLVTSTYPYPAYSRAVLVGATVATIGLGLLLTRLGRAAGDDRVEATTGTGPKPPPVERADDGDDA